MAGTLRSYEDWTAALTGTGEKEYPGGDWLWNMNQQPAEPLTQRIQPSAPKTKPNVPIQPRISSWLKRSQKKGPSLWPTNEGVTPYKKTITEYAPEATQPASTSPTLPSEGGNLYEIPANPIVAKAYQPILNPFSQQIEKTSTGLEEAAKAFQEAAGRSRTYESIGGQNVLAEALLPDENTQKDVAEMEAAKGLTHAEYGGPEGLDQETIDALNTAAEELKSSSTGLNRLTGVEGLLQVQNPALGATQEELAYDAGRLMAQEDWQKNVSGLQSDIGTLAGQIYRTTGSAGAFAEQRAAEEEAIQKLAREYVQGRQTDVSKAITERIAGEEASNKAIEDAYAKFQATGDISALEAAGVDTSAFNTPAAQLAKEAQAALQTINQQFSDISNIPLLTAQVTTHGNAALGWDKETEKALKKQYGDKKFKELKERAKARNAALESAGFSPGVVQAEGKKYLQYKQGKTEIPAGKFSTVAPLYLGDMIGVYQPPSPVPYVTKTEGTLPTRENIATDIEREIYNRSAELLDQADRIEKANTPYEKAKLVADAQRYLDEEIAAMEARKETLDANRKDFLKKMKKVRDKYLESNKKGVLGNIGAVVGGILGFPTGPGGSALGAYLGKKIGTAVA